MSTVTTTKPINVGQLSGELGGAALSVDIYPDRRVVTALDESVTQAALEAAIDAHDAQPEPEPEPPGEPEPPPPSAASLLQAQVDELTDLFVMLMMGEL